MKNRKMWGMAFGVLAVLALIGIGGLSPGCREARAEGPAGSPFPLGVYYHLRVVRVTGPTGDPGAGIRCQEACGKPILLPDEEAWGSEPQLAHLARLLGGERAEALTGYVVTTAGSGKGVFGGRIFAGAAGIDLDFAGVPPLHPEDPHDLTLKLTDPSHPETPLAEAHILARSNVTIAIAFPSPIEGEWVALGVTPVAVDLIYQSLSLREKAEARLVTGDVVPPEDLTCVPPVFPKTAFEENRGGRVILQAIIDTGGVPRGIQILKCPANNEDICSSATEAVSKWRYKPATLNGTPVPVYFTVIVTFARGADRGSPGAPPVEPPPAQ